MNEPKEAVRVDLVVESISEEVKAEQARIAAVHAANAERRRLEKIRQEKIQKRIENSSPIPKTPRGMSAKQAALRGKRRGA